MEYNYALAVGQDFYPEPDEPVFESLFQQYERVIVESIFTSFGLDFIVRDQYGGDVDTILNVRKIGSDPQMRYKNSQNQAAYDQRGAYDSAAYHSDRRYADIVHAARKDFDLSGKKVADAYVEGNSLIPRGNKTIPRGQQAQLDHVMSAHEIHDDRGRVLAGLDGMELANSSDNLRFTNAALNNNMRDKTMEEYIQWCRDNPDRVNYAGEPGKPLPDAVEKKLRSEYSRAKKAYDAKLKTAYYTSPRFMKDLSIAAGKVGLRMGARQVFGFIFTEIWFAVKDEFQGVKSGFSLENFFHSIANGIKRGVENAKEKYKDLIQKFGEGIVAGALSSITATLCNIFFTTAKKTVTIIRQSWASVVQAAKVLLFNPDNLPFGERIRAALKILATGASVVLGVIVSAAISSSPIGAIPVVGDIIQTFCGSLVMGIMSCTMLYFLDRSELMNKLFSALNKVPTLETTLAEIKRQVEIIERYAAELMQIDLAQFKKETALFSSIAAQIDEATTDTELNKILNACYEEYQISKPWTGDFDEFMGNRSNHLVFS